MVKAPCINTAAHMAPVIFLALCMCTSVPAQTFGNTPSATSKPLHALPVEYQRWLHHEVLWIISPDERVAFERLSTNWDRDRFVEEFWQRRNPSPGGAKNDFKEEHYSRLAYANEHFADLVPGGETDRGRIYIVYGAPTASKAVSVRDATGSTKPTELWHYDSIPGLGEMNFNFVDFCNCGNYRLETPLKN